MEMRFGWSILGCRPELRVLRGLRGLWDRQLAARRWTTILLYFTAAWAAAGFGQTVKRLDRTHSVFVAAIDRPAGGRGPGSSGSAELRERVIELLQHSKTLQVAPDEAAAGSVLRVKAVIWPTGTVTLNPKSQAGSFTNYEGYATAYLYAGGDTGDAVRGTRLASAKPGRVLWTYLATPKRFRFDPIGDDLAAQIVVALELELGGAARGGFAAGAAGKGASLEVAGATLPAPLYLKWFESFESQPGGVPMTYDAVGSVAGMEELRAGMIDIAATDIPAAQGEDESALRVPSVAGAIVPIYDLTSGNDVGRTARTGESLNLTGAMLAAIYAGKITMWDDPAIAAANRGTRLPHAAISVVHRSDGSGTTFVWTSFLAQSDPDWKTRVGATVDWHGGLGVAGNEGVAEKVAATPNSIGYVELAYAIQHRLRYAAVRNPAGRYIKANIESVSAAAETASGPAGSVQGLVLNGPAKDAYPIATFTWLVVPQPARSAEESTSIKAFLRWMLTSGQKQCSALGYAPLPKAMAVHELKVVDSLK